MMCLSFVFRKSKRKTPRHPLVQHDDDFSGIENVRMYSYNELRLATRDFSPDNKVGEGGFGCVYKGTLKDGTKVAVKVLSSDSRQGVKEFLTEITVVSDIVHENLVKLYGCCVERNNRILVYNYLENNSLAQTLLGSKRSNIKFDWKTRSRICIGVARGLAFLHEEVEPHIVHRDIKASNVLLDEDLTPKISDFGLAKILPANITHVSTRVAGTVGYLAPEYAIRGQVTKKSDIYSFGVLLLEIISGRCNTNTRLSYEDHFLLETSPDIMHGILVLQTWRHYERGNLAGIIDALLNEDLDAEEACRFLKIGLLCTQDTAKLRPSMSTVVQMLTGERQVNEEEITKPGLISDFMDMKIRNQKKHDEGSSYSSSRVETSPMSTASITFTAISERD